MKSHLWNRIFYGSSFFICRFISVSIRPYHLSILTSQYRTSTTFESIAHIFQTSKCRININRCNFNFFFWNQNITCFVFYVLCPEIWPDCEFANQTFLCFNCVRILILFTSSSQHIKTLRSYWLKRRFIGDMKKRKKSVNVISICLFIR